jgi:hypothetical protein
MEDANYFTPTPTLTIHQANRYPQIVKWLIQQVFGGTTFLACARIFAQPGKAVPPVRKTCG